MTTFLVDHPQRIISKYRCGACWDVLLARPADDRKYQITCVNCGDNVPGFVHVNYVDRRQAESHVQYDEARRALENAWPYLFPDVPIPIEVNLKILGF